MRHTVRMAARGRRRRSARIRAFPDLAGFGRREMSIEPREIADLVLYQIGALSAIAKAEGAHASPREAARRALQHERRGAPISPRRLRGRSASFDDDLVLVGLPGSELLSAGARLGLRVAAEAFADRSYEADGSLTPRRIAGAVLSATRSARPSARSGWCATVKSWRATDRRFRSRSTRSACTATRQGPRSSQPPCARRLERGGR